MTSEVVSIDALCREFGRVNALEGVTLIIPRGEIVALVFVTIEDLTALSTPLDMEFAGYIIY